MGTVDLTARTYVRSGAKPAATSRAASSTYRVSALPLAVDGVPTAIMTTSASRTARGYQRKTSSGHVLAIALHPVRLTNWASSFVEQLQLAQILVDTDDVVTDVGCHHSHGQADVPSSDHC